MKQLTLLIFTFCCLSVLSQNSDIRIVAKTEIFFTQLDTNWVEVDSIGDIFREIKISADNSKLELTMKNGLTIENYIYFIDSIGTHDATINYFCRDEFQFPLICEFNGAMVGLYYYYDAKTNEFEKAERMIVQSSR